MSLVLFNREVCRCRNVRPKRLVLGQFTGAEGRDSGCGMGGVIPRYQLARASKQV